MKNTELEAELVRVVAEHSLIPPGSRVLVAVSGGADSVCLLHLLYALAESTGGFGMVVAHLDHCLRAESGADARFVADLCVELGLSCHVKRVDVGAMAQQRKQGVEEAGRTARRQFLQQLAAETGCERIALAHHCDDLAETVLLRLTRGSGVSGLSAMVWCDGLFIRPLLGISRQQVEQYLRQHKIAFVEDASNNSMVYARNRIRHQVLPQLRHINPEASACLARLAQLVTVEESYWDQQVSGFMRHSSCWQADQLRLECCQLRAQHPALQLRVVREALRQVRGNLAAIEAVHLEAIVALLDDGRPQRELSLPQVWVARRYQQLVFSAQPPRVSSAPDLLLNAPGRFELPDGRVLCVDLVCTAGDTSSDVVEFDAAQLPFPLWLRMVEPGDRISCDGMSGRKKVKKIFAERRVEIEQRRMALVLGRGDELLWLVGLHRCAQYQPREGSTMILRCRILSA